MSIYSASRPDSLHILIKFKYKKYLLFINVNQILKYKCLKFIISQNNYTKSGPYGHFSYGFLFLH